VCVGVCVGVCGVCVGCVDVVVCKCLLGSVCGVVVCEFVSVWMRSVCVCLRMCGGVHVCVIVFCVCVFVKLCLCVCVSLLACFCMLFASKSCSSGK